MRCDALIRFQRRTDTPRGLPVWNWSTSPHSSIRATTARSRSSSRAAALADGHEPLGEHKYLRLQRGDDLAAAVLAFEDGALAGYAHTVTYGEDEPAAPPVKSWCIPGTAGVDWAAAC